MSRSTALLITFTVIVGLSQAWAAQKQNFECRQGSICNNSYLGDCQEATPPCDSLNCGYACPVKVKLRCVPRELFCCDEGVVNNCGGTVNVHQCILPPTDTVCDCTSGPIIGTQPCPDIYDCGQCV